MIEEPSLEALQKSWPVSFYTYLAGYVLSVLLTLGAFFLVFIHFAGWALIFSLIALGFVQAIVQLIFFLHLSHEFRTKWETLVFFFLIIVLLVIVIGSLWVMHNLNQRVMGGMEGTFS